MTTPARRAAERIIEESYNLARWDHDTKLAGIMQVIEKSYAPIIKQAREAMEFGVDAMSRLEARLNILSNPGERMITEQTKDKLRTALEQLLVTMAGDDANPSPVSESPLDPNES